MPKNIKVLLRDVLQEQGLSLRRLAELTGIDKATISRIINGKRKPTLQHLKKFSEALKLPLQELVEAVNFEEELQSATEKKPLKENSFAPQRTSEIEVLQQSVQLYDRSVTLDKITAELEKYEEYTGTYEGKTMVQDGFEAKVNHFGNIGPYIERLKSWHRKFLLADGSKKDLALMGGALLYFILPLDLLHDYIFAVGYLDDCLAIQLAGNRLENKV